MLVRQQYCLDRQTQALWQTTIYVWSTSRLVNQRWHQNVYFEMRWQSTLQARGRAKTTQNPPKIQTEMLQLRIWASQHSNILVFEREQRV